MEDNLNIFRGASLSRSGPVTHSVTQGHFWESMLPFKNLAVLQDPTRPSKILQDPDSPFKIMQDPSSSYKILQILQDPWRSCNTLLDLDFSRICDTWMKAKTFSIEKVIFSVENKYFHEALFDHLTSVC